MIDIHSHILWGVDDGAHSLADSLEMCRIAYRDGIRTIVATPHTLNGLYQNDRTSILAKVQELNEVISNQLLVNSLSTNNGSRITDNELRNRLSVTRSEFSHPLSVTSSKSHLRTTDNKYPLTDNKSPITHNQFQLKILPGADVCLCEGTLSQLEGGKVTTLGDGGKCLLLEFPIHGIPHGAERVLFQLLARGITPIISHPERNLEVGRRPQRYHEMIRMGCLGQLTAMSLTGGFGPGVVRVAEGLLTKGLVHLIASDAHSTDGRPPILSHAVRAAAAIVGRKEAWKMITEYPRAILEGRRPDFLEPKPDG
jgi:tyrosine-protein phosphatase YwqE